MSDKEKKVIHEMKTTVPKETAKGEPFKVENPELTEKELETAGGGLEQLQPDVCACLCGQGTGCSGGGGG